MKAGTHFSSNATGGFVIDRMDNTLSKLNEEGLRYLLGTKPARDVKRKIERRLKRMKVESPKVELTGATPQAERPG